MPPPVIRPRSPVSVALHASMCVFGSAWALTLAIAGLWLCFTAPARWPMIGTAAMFAGIAVLAAAVLVFGVLVADRLFPGAERRFAWGVELCSSLFMVLGAVAVLLAVLSR
jgi:hypothetical protein